MSLERIEAQDREAAETELEMAIGNAPPEEDLQRLVARLLEERGIGGQQMLAGDDLAQAIGRAWMMGARVVMNTVLGRGPCRVCGCWELEACEEGCAWAEPGLCTACVAAEEEICSVCAKPIQSGSPVRYYDDVGEVHAHPCGGATPEQAVAGGRIPVDPDEFGGDGQAPEFVTVYLSGDTAPNGGFTGIARGES